MNIVFLFLFLLCPASPAVFAAAAISVVSSVAPGLSLFVYAVSFIVDGVVLVLVLVIATDMVIFNVIFKRGQGRRVRERKGGRSD